MRDELIDKIVGEIRRVGDCSLNDRARNIICMIDAARQAPASGEVVADELRTPEQNRRVNKLMGKLWDVYTDDDPDAQLKVHRVWDLLVRFEAEVSATHPPAKVPEYKTARDFYESGDFLLSQDLEACEQQAEGWNKCRRAMLTTPTPATTPQPAQQGNVPKGWQIKPFEGGITVLWPGQRGGVHVKTGDEHNSIAEDVLHDLARAMVLTTPQPEGDGWIAEIDIAATNYTGWCWIVHKGRVVSSYRDKNGIYRFHEASPNCFMSECVTFVMPWERPQPPVEQDGTPHHRSSEQ